jgi:hypothetical protein
MGRINGHKPTGRIMQNSYFSYFCSEITAEWLQSYFQYFSSQTTPKFELIFIQHTCRGDYPAIDLLYGTVCTTTSRTSTALCQHQRKTHFTPFSVDTRLKPRSDRVSLCSTRIFTYRIWYRSRCRSLRVAFQAAANTVAVATPSVYLCRFFSTTPPSFSPFQTLVLQRAKSLISHSTTTQARHSLLNLEIPSLVYYHTSKTPFITGAVHFVTVIEQPPLFSPPSPPPIYHNGPR